MNRGTEGRVLLVGEGNFSLSASLVADNILSGAQMVTSCLSSQVSVQEAHENAQESIEYLAKSGNSNNTISSSGKKDGLL